MSNRVPIHHGDDSFTQHRQTKVAHDLQLRHQNPNNVRGYGHIINTSTKQ